MTNKENPQPKDLTPGVARVQSDFGDASGEDAEVILSSPQQEHNKVIDQMRGKMGGSPDSGGRSLPTPCTRIDGP